MVYPDTGKAALVAAALLCISAAGYFYCAHASMQYYAQSLSHAGVQETVYLGSTTYEVSGGVVHTGSTTVQGLVSWRALKLAYAVTLARRAPLYALPGTNPSVLATQARLLITSEEQIAAKQKTQLFAEAVRHLYPTSFILSLADLELKRQALLSHPAEVSAQNYASALLATVAAKESDLANFKKFFIQSVDTNNTQIALFSGVMSTKSQIASLSQFQIDLVSEKAAVASMYRCMQGVTVQCRMQLAVSLPEEKAAKVPDTPLADAKEAGALWDESYGEEAGTSTVAILNQSSCLTDTAGPNRVKLLSAKTPEGPIDVLANGDTIYFKTVEPGSTTFDSYLSDTLGMQYTPINAFKYYVCPQVGIDYGAALAVVRIAAFSKEHAGLAAAQSRMLENGSDAPPEFAARAYLLAALQSKNTTPQERHTLEELALLLSVKAGGLEEIIKDIVHITAADTGPNLSPVIKLQASQMFLTHSAFPTFFRIGDNNPAALVILYSQSPKAMAAFEDHHTSYAQLRSQVSRSVLLHDLRSFLTIENRTAKAAPSSTPAANNNAEW